MKVNVELSGESSIDGLLGICEAWRTQFPMGRLIGMTAYGKVTATLEMPPATQVIPPQLVDARVQEES